jgi:hypothetical protein
MDFEKKIDKILTERKLTITKLAEISGLKDTLHKAYRENREMSERKTVEFLQNVGISSTWWESGQGDIFTKHKTASQPAPDFERGLVYKDLVETNSNYKLVPNTLIDGEYRMVQANTLMTQDKLINQLMDEVSRLWALVEEFKSQPRTTKSAK